MTCWLWLVSLRYSCCFTISLHPHFVPLLNNFPMHETFLYTIRAARFVDWNAQKIFLQLGMFFSPAGNMISACFPVARQGCESPYSCPLPAPLSVTRLPPSFRTFPSSCGRDTWILLHLCALPGQEKGWAPATDACPSTFARAKTANFSCFCQDLAWLEGLVYWCCTSFLFVCLVRWCDVNYWLSAFERETVAGRTFHFFHLPNLPIKFQGMTISPLIIYIYLIYK